MSKHKIGEAIPKGEKWTHDELVAAIQSLPSPLNTRKDLEETGWFAISWMLEALRLRGVSMGMARMRAMVNGGVDSGRIEKREVAIARSHGGCRMVVYRFTKKGG